MDVKNQPKYFWIKEGQVYSPEEFQKYLNKRVPSLDKRYNFYSVSRNIVSAWKVYDEKIVSGGDKSSVTTLQEQLNLAEDLKDWDQAREIREKIEKLSSNARQVNLRQIYVDKYNGFFDGFQAIERTLREVDENQYQELRKGNGQFTITFGW